MNSNKGIHKAISSGILAVMAAMHLAIAAGVVGLPFLRINVGDYVVHGWDIETREELQDASSAPGLALVVFAAVYVVAIALVFIPIKRQKMATNMVHICTWTLGVMCVAMIVVASIGMQTAVSIGDRFAWKDLLFVAIVATCTPSSLFVLITIMKILKQRSLI